MFLTFLLDVLLDVRHSALLELNNYPLLMCIINEIHFVYIHFVIDEYLLFVNIFCFFYIHKCVENTVRKYSEWKNDRNDRNADF